MAFDLPNYSFEFYWIVFFGIILGRYFLIAGGIYLVFYWVFQQFILQRGAVSSENLIHKDIELSLLSTVIFSLGAAFIMKQYHSGNTLLYTSIHDYGIWYLGVSFIAVLFLQDSYFYFTHRLFHHPLLFKWFHQGHHRSKKPTPFTSFAFDPAEALVQMLFLVGIVFIIPLHFITLLAVLMTMTLWAILTHLGFQLFPASIPYCWFGKWLIGSAHHSLHHRKYTVHFGLYFTIWDRLLHTQDKSYEHQLNVSSRK